MAHDLGQPFATYVVYVRAAVVAREIIPPAVFLHRGAVLGVVAPLGATAIRLAVAPVCPVIRLAAVPVHIVGLWRAARESVEAVEAVERQQQLSSREASERQSSA